MKLINLTGKRFGKLTVLKFAERRVKKSRGARMMWACRCDCGIEKIVCGSELRQGKTKSCGCWKNELVGNSTRRHGLTRTTEYFVWWAMIARCRYKSSKSYKDYGGRGIKVCERWLKFENFLEDMGKRPSPKHTIERKDGNGHYCLENCSWETRKVQNRNKRNTRWLTARGETHSVAEWCEILGLSQGLVGCRLRLGWSHEDALFRAIGNNGPKKKSSPNAPMRHQ